jgi:hypothetical protein
MVRWAGMNRAAPRRRPGSAARRASAAIAAAEVATHSAVVVEIAAGAMRFVEAVGAAEIAVADAGVDEERHEESTIESTCNSDRGALRRAHA